MRNTISLKAAVVLSILFTSTLARLRTAATGENPERGDVPGWVMITLMSAVLVAGILAIAKPALEGMFSDAMNQVSQP
jgi:ABC-type uncharacterized transport system permease subunit